MTGARILPVGTVRAVPAAAWDALAGPEELYTATPWMRILEATSGTRMRYLLAYDGGDLVGGLATARAHATAPWQAGRTDSLLERCVRENRDGARELRDRLPADLTAALLPGLVCGGRHLGRNRLLGRDPAVAAGLVAAAERLAEQDGSRSVAFLYVDAEDKQLRRVLEERGYDRYCSARYHCLPVTSDGYQGYLRRFTGHRRRRIEADRRRLRSAGVAVEIEPLSADLVPRLAELETLLMRRYGLLDWPASLSASILSRVLAQLGDTATVSLSRRDGLVTGFVLLLRRGRSWYAHRAGFDYAANGGLPVYFDVTYNRPLEAAAALGVTAIHYGTGSDDTKRARGCLASDQYAYLRVMNQPGRTT